jgi:glycosyltransferase involved in cell wall biosynthesis
MAPCPAISVLLISHSYPPVMGGSEVEAQRVAAALIARGHRVTVLCSGGAPMPAVHRWTDPLGVPVRIYGMRGSRLWRDRVFAAAVAWTLFKERHNYQVAYFLMQGLHLAAGLPVAKWLKKPIVMKISGSNIVTLMQQFRLGRLELKWLRKWARRIMILNDGIAREALEAGLRKEQLFWMPNPVDVAKFSPPSATERRELRAAAGIDRQTVVVYVGRLAPEKDLPCLLDAFARLASSGRDALLVLVGDGPDRGALEEKSAALGISARVRFTGMLAAEDVIAWLRAADIFALVSEFEGFPCSLVEAMAAGLPSVVSDIPGNTQLVESGVQGFTAPRGQSAAIAGALDRLFADPGLRAQMGAAARQHVVDRYAVDYVIDRYETLFAEALEPGQ